jgi:hypothetical protein
MIDDKNTNDSFIKCPSCNERPCVIDTRPIFGGRRRRYCCACCGRRFSTVEVEVNEGRSIPFIMNVVSWLNKCSLNQLTVAAGFMEEFLPNG